MKKNYIITGICIVAIIVLFTWIARPASPGSREKEASLNSLSNGVLTASESQFDFGSISMAAGNVKHSFKVRNTGGEPVVIEKMYTSCMCTSANLIKGGESYGPYGMPGHGFIPKINKTVNPGEEIEVEAVFDPTAHGPAGVGVIQRSVILENNSADQSLELQFSAEVRP